MQLPLEFRHKEVKTFENFIIGENQLLINSLKDFLADKQQSLFLIWGHEKSGKSHLLNALHTQLQDHHLSSVYFKQDILDERDQLQLIPLFDHVMIDDIDQIAEKDQSEENLFQWINEIRQSHKKLILTSNAPINSITWGLPDLKSRLQSAQSHQITPLDRNDLLILFTREAEIRGLKLDQKAIQYIEKNCPMNPGFLMSLLMQLDNITLVKKKSVTVPLIRQLLNSNLVNRN
jgi:DnaA family protein